MSCLLPPARTDERQTHPRDAPRRHRGEAPRRLAGAAPDRAHLLHRAPHAAAIERPLDYVIGYCELLAAAGVEPLYRESEPLF